MGGDRSRVIHLLQVFSIPLIAVVVAARVWSNAHPARLKAWRNVWGAASA